jgi:glutamate/tyrosine decarboxylase-like PLP-dependent enzyme
MLNLLNRLPPGANRGVERLLKSIPPVRNYIERQYDSMMADLEEELHPYGRDHKVYARLPKEGVEREEILREMEEFLAAEQDRWAKGYASGAVYSGDPAHIDFLNRVYALNSQSNPLHADLWPSAIKFESEMVAMTARMLGADRTPDEIVGTVTSGGTESILLAIKTYRDRARAERGVKRPQIIVPTTAHVAFEKAAHYFGVKLVRIPVGPDYRADVEATRKAINKRTIAIVGSAPTFPHGVIDPIYDLSELARERGIGFHTDACLGGFVLPWAEKLGYPVPPFDFRLPGVTSMSADTHKYGYAAKGTSVVLYRGKDLRRYQYYTATDWPGGLYFSPTLAGSRPGGLSAAGWAALVSMGEEGYMEATARILAAGRFIRASIERIPELTVLGDPLWVIAFGSRTLNIYNVMEQMSRRGWSLNGLDRPPAVHIAVTLRHTQPGVAQRFIEDLRDAVDYVKTHPDESTGMAPVYGMASSMPLRGLVGDILTRYVDMIYSVPGQ